MDGKSNGRYYPITQTYPTNQGLNIILSYHTNIPFFISYWPIENFVFEEKVALWLFLPISELSGVNILFRAEICEERQTVDQSCQYPLSEVNIEVNSLGPLFFMMTRKSGHSYQYSVSISVI